MKILMLGAGAIGGYLGARIHLAGGDMSFLVRPARARQLLASGLQVVSPFGDMARRASAMGVATPLLDIAHCHLQAYECRRRREQAAAAAR